jgi:plasmid stabilization system protein ParE
VKLVIAQLALEELHDAAAFYAQKAGVELGLAFIAEFERTANLIMDNPRIGTIFHGKRRRCLMHRFPYGIIYQVATDEIRIVAVAHHRRRPGY